MQIALMGVLTTFLALLSCALIGTGIWLVLRDARRSKARQAAQMRSTMTAPVVKAPVVKKGAKGESAGLGRIAPASAEASSAVGSEVVQDDPRPADDGADADSAHLDLAPRIPWVHSLPSALASALRAVNGAFAPAGIALVPDAPSRAVPAAAIPPELAVALMAHGQPAGSLQVHIAGDTIEIAAWSGSGAADDVRRVRTLNGAEATIPALAEAIAACAWPVVTAAMSRNPTAR